MISATGFDAVSASRITAVAPPSATAASVPVAVTTVAGTATGPRFTYGDATPSTGGTQGARCVVPNLKGKNLKAAKKALTKARCKLGKVTNLSRATAKTGKVSKQGSKPGAKLPAGAKVTLTLKPRR